MAVDGREAEDGQAAGEEAEDSAALAGAALEAAAQAEAGKSLITKINLQDHSCVIRTNRLHCS